MKAMCGVQLRYRKRSMDLMFMLGFNEAIGQLVIKAVVAGMVMCCAERAFMF